MRSKLNGVAIRLVKDRPLYSSRPIKNCEDAVRIVGEDMADLDREEVRIIMMDSSGKPIAYNTVSVGSLNNSIVSPRELLKPIILLNAASVILLHNHPSQSLEPSQEDIFLTERLNKLFALFSIQFLDHIIVGEQSRYYSFAENRRIDRIGYRELEITGDLDNINLPGLSAVAES